MTEGKSVEEYRDFFAAVFAELDARPRATGVEFMPGGLSIDVDCGNPVFTLAGRTLRADFRGRWLAEHPVPLGFSAGRAARLYFTPTTGNRIKVSSKRRSWFG